MLDNNSDINKVVTDAGEEKVATIGSFVNMAKGVLENTRSLDSAPTPEDVKKSTEEWNKKYKGFEEKKASAEVTETDRYVVQREVDRSEFHRYPPLLSGAEAYGYTLDEVRLFDLGDGLFGVTTLDGVDITESKPTKHAVAKDTTGLNVLMSSGLVAITEQIEALTSDVKRLEGKIDCLLDEVAGLLGNSKGSTDKPKEPTNRKAPRHNVPQADKGTTNPLGYDISAIVVEEAEWGAGFRTSTEQGVIADYKSGVPILSIRQRYGISSGTVYAILNKNHIPLRSTGNSKGVASAQVAKYIDDEDKRNQLIDAYTKGDMPLRTIYSTFNITKNGLFHVLDMFSVPRRAPKRLQDVMV